MKEPIRGKVAQVLNSREIAMNVGSADGVVTGMYFDIQEPESITDPDTEEVLGVIDRSKVRVRVTHVQERLSVASTYRKRRVNVGGVGGLTLSLDSVSQLLTPPKWVTKYETLKTDEKTWEDLEEEESYVSTGDLVVQVIEDQDKEEQEDGEN